MKAELATVTQLTELTNRNYRTVRKRIEGLEPLHQEGQMVFYNLRDAVKAICNQDQVDSDDMDELKVEREKAEIRLSHARAQKIEFEMEVKRGERVPMEEVNTLLNEAICRLRERLLSLPHKTAAVGFQCKTPYELETLIRENLYDAMEEIGSDGFVESLLAKTKRD